MYGAKECWAVEHRFWYEHTLLFFIELELFTKYLREEREALHRDETTINRKLDTQKDVTKAYSQQHMPTIPQFYEHV